MAYVKPIEIPQIEMGSTIPTSTPENLATGQKSGNNEQDLCFCMRTARNLGAKLPYVDAKDLTRNGIPSQGGVVILKYGEVYHVAYIKYLFPGGMWVGEGNFSRCAYTERFIYFTDSNLIGFYTSP